MKYLKLYENFREATREEMFGKQTTLQRQFSEVVVSGLNNEDRKIGEFWACFNALKIELKEYIDTEDNLYKEMQYRIVDDQEPVGVMEDIISRMETGKTTEMERLLKKMSDNNPYKYKEETYSEEDEGMAR